VQSGIAWGYWVLMLAHFATMFNAYRPSTLFVGEVRAWGVAARVTANSQASMCSCWQRWACAACSMPPTCTWSPCPPLAPCQPTLPSSFTPSCQITAITPLLKQTWSAGFLAAAFTCDALKTAADRHHLGRVGNRQLNLALMLLEGTFAAVLVFGMTVTGEWGVGGAWRVGVGWGG
jgi:hypothetical protein